MKTNLHRKVLGLMLGLGLTGTVGVWAQTSTQTEKQTQNSQDSQMCPMMKDGAMNMSMMKDGKMDMSKMMDCCKKMSMKNDRPAAYNNNSEPKPDSEQ